MLIFLSFYNLFFNFLLSTESDSIIFAGTRHCEVWQWDLRQSDQPISSTSSDSTIGVVTNKKNIGPYSHKVSKSTSSNMSFDIRNLAALYTTTVPIIEKINSNSFTLKPYTPVSITNTLMSSSSSTTTKPHLTSSLPNKFPARAIQLSWTLPMVNDVSSAYPVKALLVLWRGWCGTMKRVVWYSEESDLVLWRGWCGVLKKGTKNCFILSHDSQFQFCLK